ncbi:MAG TPA: PLD nuclease N-terminal domain-containing protein [Candidatus Saccharimonadia bacterium]|nr:PLD nuclease N-terminal domain-containing protein [Candidatus Saccharimonadia bacterium]
MNNIASATATKNITLTIAGPLIIIAVLIFVIWMLVDAIRKPIKNKAIWIIVILLFNLWGALLYLLIGKKNLKDTNPSSPIQPSMNQTGQNIGVTNSSVTTQPIFNNEVPAQVTKPESPQPSENQIPPTSPNQETTNGTTSPVVG